MTPNDPAALNDLPSREPIYRGLGAAGLTEPARTDTPDPLADPVRREGADAYAAGVDKWANPYKKQDHNHGQWKFGWKYARDKNKNQAPKKRAA